MTGLIIFVGIVLILQVVLFFVIRKKRNKVKENSIIERYDIKTTADAFRLLQDADIPEKDRKEIEKLYQGKT